MQRALVALEFAVVCAWLIFPIQAQEYLPLPQLHSIFPMGGQKGTTLEVSVLGEHLDGATQLLFSRPGIQSRRCKNADGEWVEGRFEVQIDHSMEGACDVRVLGKFGLSNPRRFVVSSQPEQIIISPATERKNALTLPRDCVVHVGTVSGTPIWFAFPARAGEELHIVVDAPDSKVDPRITVLDEQGNSILRGGGRTWARSFIPKVDGEYFLAIHDLLYRSGSDFRLRLVLSTTKSDMMETDTDGLLRSLFKESEVEHILKVASNRVEIPIDEELTVPSESIGRFPPQGCAATYLLRANQGDPIWIDLASHRFGCASDVSLVIEPADSASVGSEKNSLSLEATDIEHSSSAIGFGLESRDGILKLDAPKDGLYRISVRDVFNTSPGRPRMPYRLSVRRPNPNFEMIAFPDQGPRGRPIPSNVSLLPLNIRRGGTVALRVFAVRQDGFAGDIELNIENLPDGVQCLGATLGLGDDCASLVLYANEEATLWSGSIRVIGRAKAGDQEIAKEAKYGSMVWSVKDTRQEPFRARRIESMGLAVVSEMAPVMIEPEVDRFEAKPNDKITVKINVVRRNGYDGIINLRPFVLGDPDKSIRSDHAIPQGATSASLEIDLSKLDVQPGEHSFIFHGNVDKIKYSKNSEEIPLLEETLRLATEEVKHEEESVKELKASIASQKKSLQSWMEKRKKASTEEEKSLIERESIESNATLMQNESKLRALERELQKKKQVKTHSENRLKDAKKTSAPKDYSFPLFSKPIRIRIHANTGK